MKKILLALAVIVILVAAFMHLNAPTSEPTTSNANVAAQTFTLKHSEGTVELPQTPERIVSYDLGVLDTLTFLGIDVAGVPKSMHEGNMAPLADKPVAGTLFEPDYDVLTTLKPDLLFAGGRSAAQIPNLEAHAPVAIYNLDVNNFLDSFNQSNLELARAFNKEAEAQDALESINANVKTLQERNQGKTGAFLFVVSDFVIAHAPGERFGFTYEITGLTSVLPAADPAQTQAPRPAPGSPEAQAAAIERAKVVTQVAEANPDWLIVLDRGAINGAKKTAADKLAKHPELSQTDAFKNGNVFYIDPNPWYVITGGLANFHGMTEEMLERFE